MGTNALLRRAGYQHRENFPKIAQRAAGRAQEYASPETVLQWIVSKFGEWMRDNDIPYAGVAPDETLLAHKDIDEVMEPQEGVVVRTIAEMHPVAVVMGG